MVMNLKQREMKIKPRIKLNYNIDTNIMPTYVIARVV